MQQRLVVNDLKVLTLEQQRKLRLLWTPKAGDWVIHPAGNWLFDLDIKPTLIHEEDNYSFADCLPLLNIGQCIELLQNGNGRLAVALVEYFQSVDKHNEAAAHGITNLYVPELIGLLWEAVKEMLNNWNDKSVTYGN